MSEQSSRRQAWGDPLPDAVWWGTLVIGIAIGVLALTLYNQHFAGIHWVGATLGVILSLNAVAVLVNRKRVERR